MTKKAFVALSGILFICLLAVTLLIPSEVVNASSQQSSSCSVFETGSFPAESAIDFDFTCDQPTTLYFGVCDSGGVEDDDLLNITFNGAVVSANAFDEGGERTTVGTADVAVGSHTAVVNSLNPGVGFATYAVAITSDIGAMADYLFTRCGGDFINNSIVGGECTRSVPVFITEPASTAGTLRLKARYGEMNQMEGITLEEWRINAGDRVNNALAQMPAPDYARLWWLPAGETEWHLLPSQYWQGDGSTASEYGLSCDSDMGVPSYHSSFADAIPASDVPLLKR